MTACCGESATARLSRPALAEPRQEQHAEREERRAGGGEHGKSDTRRTGGLPDERAGDEERERRDGDEVPVDVDERVQEERGQDERERELVPAAAEAAAQERSAH